MALGIPPSPTSPGNPWAWPPVNCSSVDEPWDYINTIELVETDPDNF